MKLSCTIEQIPHLVGASFGPASWETIDQTRIDRFAHASGDHQWIHVDPDRAAEGPFGGTIAHGYLSLAIVPMLMSEVFAVTDKRFGLNYGLDRVRFLQPVPVDARVRLSGSIAEVKGVRDGAQVKFDVAVEVEGGGDRAACLATPIYRYLK